MTFRRPRSTSFSMRTLILALVVLHLPLHAAEAPRAYPLWDGHESVAAYAQRVNLPPTKQLDLGNGVTLDLVLIPAGQFIMGSAEPAKPRITVAASERLIWLGGAAAAVLLLVLLIKCVKKRKLTFSLCWLLLMMIAAGVCVGGFARRPLALKEAARYESELVEFNGLPANEKPAHTVTISQPFYMGKYTVTQDQYTALSDGRSPRLESVGGRSLARNRLWQSNTQLLFVAVDADAAQPHSRPCSAIQYPTTRSLADIQWLFPKRSHRSKPPEPHNREFAASRRTYRPHLRCRQLLARAIFARTASLF